MNYIEFKCQNDKTKEKVTSIGRVKNVNFTTNTCTLILDDNNSDNLPIQTVVDNIAINNSIAISNPSILQRWEGFDGNSKTSCNYCCSNNKPLHWKDDENNAFINNKGEISVMVKDKLLRFKVKFCPKCGREF